MCFKHTYCIFIKIHKSNEEDAEYWDYTVEKGSSTWLKDTMTEGNIRYFNLLSEKVHNLERCI